MDILIKNMEQIDGCYYCPFLTGTICCACLITGNKVGIDVVRDKYEDERMADCPLVTLPSHGRLGDLDALKNSVADMRMEKPLRNGAKQVIEIGELFGRIIDDAPTIVEATNE